MDAGVHGGMDHGTGMHGGMAGMAMSFNFDVNPVLLFDFWKPNNAGTLAASCLLIFILTVAFEALKAYREKLYIESKRDANTEITSTVESVFEPNHLKQTALYTVQITLGYLLMLLFMTYNGFVAITIIVGAAFGFLVTGWKKYLMLEMASDHCG